jgi:hypothetical protein
MEENKVSISFKIDKNFASNFDVLENIQVGNRKSNKWFSDDNKLMLYMRDWTSQLWDTQPWTGWVSWLYFFTDFHRKRHRIKGYNNRVWRLDTSTNTWVDLWVVFTWNDFIFNTVKLPHNISDTTISTEYTCPSDASWSELVKKDPTDTQWASAIWKVILITDNPWDNQSYRWTFWYITWYDTSTQEYIIWNSWIIWSLDTQDNIIWLKSWSKYKIYDTLWEHLQVCNWVEFERYFYWKEDWTIWENTTVTWFATKQLRIVKALTNTQFLKKQVNYYNSYFTFNKWTLFYSAWAVNNPFFYTFVNSLTIPWIKWWDINDIFVFKKRLVIAWSNFIAYLPWMADLIQVEIISDSYWMKEKSFVDVWVDAYFLSSDNQIYSLSEVMSWTLIATNQWKHIDNYIKNFNTKICAWFNWRQLFFYWQKDANTAGVIVVLDLQYKFWSIYTWLRPSSIVSENWVTYFTDNNSSIVRYFNKNVTTDIWQPIKQMVAFSELILWDVFNVKALSDIYLWLENYTQSLNAHIYMANPITNWKKQVKYIHTEEAEVQENLLWEWDTLWSEILWWEVYEWDISLPFMKHIQLDWDWANIWRIILEWYNWSPFYLNEMTIEIGNLHNVRTYFSPVNTI